MILLNVVFFLLVSAVVDAFFGIFVIMTGFPLGPTPVVNLLVQYPIAGIVMFPCRLHELPTAEEDETTARAVQADRSDRRRDPDHLRPRGRRGRVAGAIYLESKFGQSPLVAAAIAFACPPYIFILITVFLGTGAPGAPEKDQSHRGTTSYRGDHSCV